MPSLITSLVLQVPSVPPGTGLREPLLCCLLPLSDDAAGWQGAGPMNSGCHSFLRYAPQFLPELNPRVPTETLIPG